MDMFDLPTEGKLLEKIKAHKESTKAMKKGNVIDSDEIFPFWSSVACAETDMKTFKPTKTIEMKNDKVGSVKPIKTAPAVRTKLTQTLVNKAQAKPEIKATLEAANGMKFKPLTVNTDTTYTVKGASAKIGSIKPIKPGETRSITDYAKIIASMQSVRMPNKVGCIKPSKTPTLKTGKNDFGVVTSDKPMKNPDPKAYAKYVTKDMDNKKKEKLVELGKPEYKMAPPKSSKSDLVGVVKVKK